MNEKFFKLYPMAKYYWVLEIGGLVTIFSVLVWMGTFHRTFLNEHSVAVMLVASVSLYGAIHARRVWIRYLVPIEGKPGMLTVIDRKTILKPGEVLRRWGVPESIHLIPLAGVHETEFKILDLSPFHDLDLLVPGFIEIPLVGVLRQHIVVTAIVQRIAEPFDELEWWLEPGMGVEEESDSERLFRGVLQDQMDYMVARVIERRVTEAIAWIGESHSLSNDALSKLVKRVMNAKDIPRSGGPVRSYGFRFLVKELSMTLVTVTETRTPC
jgi:hypothetical protein